MEEKRHRVDRKTGGARLEVILDDIRNSLGFLTAGDHARVLNIIAMMVMWQTQQSAHAVDTQTTEEGEARDPIEEARSSWQPAPGMAQWPGSIPSSADEHREDRSTEDEGGPTDAELLRAMEEYECQQEQEAAREAEREYRSLFLQTPY